MKRAGKGGRGFFPPNLSALTRPKHTMNMYRRASGLPGCVPHQRHLGYTQRLIVELQRRETAAGTGTESAGESERKTAQNNSILIGHHKDSVESLLLLDELPPLLHPPFAACIMFVFGAGLLALQSSFSAQVRREASSTHAHQLPERHAVIQAGRAGAVEEREPRLAAEREVEVECRIEASKSLS